jgi:hypothetical protein
MTRKSLAMMVVVALFAALLTVIAVPAISHGQTAAPPNAKFFPLADYSKTSLAQDVYSQDKDLSKYLSQLFKIALSVGAVLAVLRLAFAGYLYMTSDFWSSKTKAREIMGDVALGLFLLLSVYLILNQINPKLLTLDLLKEDVTPLKDTTPSATARQPAEQSAPNTTFTGQQQSQNAGSGIEPIQ